MPFTRGEADEGHALVVCCGHDAKEKVDVQDGKLNCEFSDGEEYVREDFRLSVGLLVFVETGDEWEGGVYGIPSNGYEKVI